MIYFMQPAEGGPVKIGFSKDVENRRQQLETHYRQPLAVLYVMEGDRTVEREIHGRFSHLRLGKTEQFRPADDLMAFIGRPLLVNVNPDAVEAMTVANGQVPIRLTEADREKIAAIRVHFGLPSDAAAVRYAVQQMHKMIEALPVNLLRKRARP